MKLSKNFVFALVAGAAAAGFTVFAQAGTNSQNDVAPLSVNQADAVFAGGCFWCVESDFDKLDGVLETISGYTGGELTNPTYQNHEGHLEAVRVIYDPTVVSYKELVDFHWRHIDPLDPNGQFCDKGSAYRTAFFVDTPAERETVEASKEALEDGGTLAGPIATKIFDENTFWPAEDYHQNYYKKNPRKYGFYRSRCGRDDRVEQVWANTPPIDFYVTEH